METGPLATAADRKYEQFYPQPEWVREENSDSVVFHLPGFKKEQLKVQVSTEGYIKVSGERLIDGPSNKWRRFLKEFRIPAESNLNTITAKFENATLYVIMPKDRTLPNSVQAKGATSRSLEKNNSRGSEATFGSSSCFRRAGGLMSGLRKKRVLLVSVIVVVVAVGVYAGYKHLYPEKNED